jgi:hypothetical protein
MDRVVSILIWPFLLGLASGPADGQARATKLLALKLLPQEAGFLAILQADGPMEHRVIEEQIPRSVSSSTFSASRIRCGITIPRIIRFSRGF